MSFLYRTLSSMLCTKRGNSARARSLDSSFILHFALSRPIIIPFLTKHLNSIAHIHFCLPSSPLFNSLGSGEVGVSNPFEVKIENPSSHHIKLTLKVFLPLPYCHRRTGDCLSGRHHKFSMDLPIHSGLSGHSTQELQTRVHLQTGLIPDAF